MKISLQTTGLAELREDLVGETRGVATAFKCALGEAVHYWRKMFAPYHFEESAYTRYAGIQTKAKYSDMKPVDPNYANGTVNRKYEIILKQRTGLSMASHKMRKQFWKKHRMDNRPMVFTGGTRQGILFGQYTVKGTSKAVSGHWNDARINWWGLSKANWGEKFTLGQALTHANPQEIEILLNKIRNNWFPYFLNMVQRREKLPKLAALPMAQ